MESTPQLTARVAAPHLTCGPDHLKWGVATLAGIWALENPSRFYGIHVFLGNPLESSEDSPDILVSFRLLFLLVSPTSKRVSLVGSLNRASIVYGLASVSF